MDRNGHKTKQKRKKEVKNNKEWEGEGALKIWSKYDDDDDDDADDC